MNRWEELKQAPCHQDTLIKVAERTGICLEDVVAVMAGFVEVASEKARVKVNS